MIINAVIIVMLALLVSTWVDGIIERRHQRDLEHYIDSDGGEDGR